MSRFLRFLLAAYAPLAARHLLVDGVRATGKHERDDVAAMSTADIGVNDRTRARTIERAIPLAA